VRNLGIAKARTPFRSPRANAIAERWVRSVRTECLDHVFIFNERHLAKVLAEYVGYFNHWRPHRSIGQRAPTGNTCASSKRSSWKDHCNTCARGPPSRLSASRMMSSIKFLRPTGGNVDDHVDFVQVIPVARYVGADVRPVLVIRECDLNSVVALCRLAEILDAFFAAHTDPRPEMSEWRPDWSFMTPILMTPSVYSACAAPIPTQKAATRLDFLRLIA
jgi:hypothetical protein